jgi:VIT1/CCC1 family predicted Fe2+/Mn2+ transporter
MAHDALGAHARDELGITEAMSARPLQAAGFSAASFSIGAALPLVASVVAPTTWLISTVALSSLIFLAVLGAVAARTGGASVMKGAIRVLFWGAIAMIATDLVGRLFGTAVS